MRWLFWNPPLMGEVLEGSYFLVSAPVKYGGIDGRRHGLCCWILRADSMKEQAVLRQAALEYLERDRPLHMDMLEPIRRGTGGDSERRVPGAS